MTTKFYKDAETTESKNLIRQQIMTLGSALFFTENESLLKLPVHVINNVQVDDEHQIWFLIQRPTQALTEFDAELPAKLDFFKKGIPYHVKVKGTASVIDNRTKANELAGIGVDTSALVVVKVTIKSTEYFQTVQQRPAQSWIQQSKMQLSSLFS